MHGWMVAKERRSAQFASECVHAPERIWLALNWIVDMSFSDYPSLRPHMTSRDRINCSELSWNNQRKIDDNIGASTTSLVLVCKQINNSRCPTARLLIHILPTSRKVTRVIWWQSLHNSVSSQCYVRQFNVSGKNVPLVSIAATPGIPLVSGCNTGVIFRVSILFSGSNGIT